MRETHSLGNQGCSLVCPALGAGHNQVKAQAEALDTLCGSFCLINTRRAEGSFLIFLRRVGKRMLHQIYFHSEVPFIG